MFLCFEPKSEAPADSVPCPEKLTAGYVTPDELETLYEKLGFSYGTVRSCRTANEYFRSGVELYDDFMFTELRIIDLDRQRDDCVALYIRKNLLLVVDVADEDGSTKEKFLSAVSRFETGSATLGKLLFAFFDELISTDVQRIEKLGMELSALEEQLLRHGADEDFNLLLLKSKKLLLRLRNYYEQLLDITESLGENESGSLTDAELLYMGNITKRVQRLKEDVDSLKNTVEHLQDAYNAYLDAKLNSTMKLFTVLTSIFFPLTIIVGWYGMNFQTMPEFRWKYGYAYVIVLSAVVVAALYGIGRRRRWF